MKIDDESYLKAAIKVAELLDLKNIVGSNKADDRPEKAAEYVANIAKALKLALEQSPD